MIVFNHIIQGCIVLSLLIGVVAVSKRTTERRAKIGHTSLFISGVMIILSATTGTPFQWGVIAYAFWHIWCSFVGGILLTDET